ncbi:MAG: SRPBCC family protein [Sporichthyaceae bacterium]
MSPQDLSFVETSPLRAEASFDSPASPEAVFAVLADHRNWPKWFGAVLTKVQPTSVPESGVGSTRTVWLLGLITVEERFLAWEEPHLFAFTGVGGRPPGFTKLVERVTIEPVGTGSRIVYRMAADLPAPLRPVGRLLMPGVSRSLRSGLKGLSREAVGRT